jgi:hypothetical protein
VVMHPDFACIDPPASRHAEVKDHAVTAISLDNPVFGATRKSHHPRTCHPLAQINRDRATQIGPPHINARQDSAEQGRLQPAHSSFDFGEFRHQKAIRNRY